MVKKIVRIGLWSIVVIYLITMIVYISSQSSSAKCKDIQVVVEDDSDFGFLSAKEMTRSVKAKFSYLIGAKVSKVQFEQVERYVKRWETVDKCAAYLTITGKLQISVTQREPVARLYSYGRSYYIDEKGNEFPSTYRFASRVLVVNGNIEELKNYDQLIELIHFIEDDSFWRAQIVQISVEPNGDFTLVPRVGNHTILLGSITEMERKFEILRGFYKTALQPQELDKYSRINIKYKGQVVCTKRG